MGRGEEVAVAAAELVAVDPTAPLLLLLLNPMAEEAGQRAGADASEWMTILQKHILILGFRKMFTVITAM